MSTVMEKEKTHRLIDRMPPQATWDDLMREIYVRETIERGLADSKAGRTRDVKEVRAKYKGQVIDGKKKDNRNEKTDRVLRAQRQGAGEQSARRAGYARYRSGRRSEENLRLRPAHRSATAMGRED